MPEFENGCFLLYRQHLRTCQTVCLSCHPHRFGLSNKFESEFPSALTGKVSVLVVFSVNVFWLCVLTPTAVSGRYTWFRTTIQHKILSFILVKYLNILQCVKWINAFVLLTLQRTDYISVTAYLKKSRPSARKVSYHGITFYLNVHFFRWHQKNLKPVSAA